MRHHTPPTLSLYSTLTQPFAFILCTLIIRPSFDIMYMRWPHPSLFLFLFHFVVVSVWMLSSLYIGIIITYQKFLTLLVFDKIFFCSSICLCAHIFISPSTTHPQFLFCLLFLVSFGCCQLGTFLTWTSDLIIQICVGAVCARVSVY